MKKIIKSIALLFALLLPVAAQSSLSVTQSDFPSEVINENLDVNHPQIDLLEVADERERGVRYFTPYTVEIVREWTVTFCRFFTFSFNVKCPEEFQYTKDFVETEDSRGTFASDLFEHKQHRHRIRGSLADINDVDLIPVKIPKDHFYQIKVENQNGEMFDIQPNIGVFPKDRNFEYHPLLNGNLFTTNSNLQNRNKDNLLVKQVYESDSIFFDEIVQTLTERNTVPNTHVEKFMDAKYDGEDYYIVVQPHQIRDDLNQFPVNYELIIDLTKTPFFEPSYDSTTIHYRRLLNTRGFGNYSAWRPLQAYERHTDVYNRGFTNRYLPFDKEFDKTKDSAVHGRCDSSAEYANPFPYVNEECIVYKCGVPFNLTPYGQTQSGRDMYGYDYAKRVASNQFEGCSYQFETKKDEDKHLNLAGEEYLSDAMEHFNQNTVRQNLDFNLSFNPDFLPFIKKSNEYFEKENFDKIPVMLYSNVANTNPFKQQIIPASVENERTGQTISVDLKQSKCEKRTRNSQYYDIDEIEASKRSNCFFGYVEREQTKVQSSSNDKMAVWSGDELTLSSEFDYRLSYLPERNKTLTTEKTIKYRELPNKSNVLINDNESDALSINEFAIITVEAPNASKSDQETSSIEVELVVERFNPLDGIISNPEVFDRETLILNETAPKSGIFEKEIQIEEVEELSEDNFYNEKIEFYQDEEAVNNIRVIYEDKLSLKNRRFQDRLTDSGAMISIASPYYSEDNERRRTNREQKRVSFYKPETAEFMGDYSALATNDTFDVEVRDCTYVAQNNRTVAIENKTLNRSFEFELSPSDDGCSLKREQLRIVQPDIEDLYEKGTYIVAERDDEIVATWEDELDDDGVSQIIEQSLLIESEVGSDGQLRARIKDVGQFSTGLSNIPLVGGDQYVEVQVVDSDLIRNANKRDTAIVVLKNKTKSTEEEFEIKEIEDCSDFSICPLRGSVKVSDDASDEGLIVAIDDEIEIIYEDRRTNSGNIETREIETVVVDNAGMSVESTPLMSIGKEINIGFDNDSNWENHIPFSDRSDYRLVKIINETKDYSFTKSVRSNNQFKGINLIPYSSFEGRIDKERSGAFASIDMPVDVDDEITFQRTDIFGDESNFEEFTYTTVVDEELGDDEFAFFVDTLDVSKDPVVTIYDKSQSTSDSEKNTVSVAVEGKPTFNIGFEENEELTLTETDVDSGIFKKTLNLVAKDKDEITPENQVLEFPEQFKQEISEPVGYSFLYEKENEDGSTTQKQIEKELFYSGYNASVSIIPKSPEIGEWLTIEVVDKNTEKSSVDVEVRVFSSDELINTTELSLSQSKEGKYRESKELIDPPHSEGSFQYELECSGGHGGPILESAGKEETSSSFFRKIPMTPEVICAKDGYEIEVEYLQANKLNATNVSGILESPELKVDNDILIEDVINVEVEDKTLNPSDSEREIEVEAMSFINPYDSFNNFLDDIDELSSIPDVRGQETVTLIETSVGSNVFQGSIEITEREEEPADGVLESKITKFSNEILAFTYLDEDMGVITLDTDFERPVLAQEFRKVLGGFTGIFDHKDEVPVNREHGVVLTDKDREEQVDIIVKNERTGEEKTYQAFEENIEGVFFLDLPIYTENEASEQDLTFKPNDVVSLSYEDSENRLLEEETIKSDFRVMPGNQAGLDVDEVVLGRATKVEIDDLDANTDSETAQTVEVEVINVDRNESYTLTAEQVSSDDNMFDVYFVPQHPDVSLSGDLIAESGDTLQFNYVDEQNEDNEREVISVEREVRSGFDGEIESPDTVFIEREDSELIEVTVVDEDLNTNPNQIQQETIKVINERTDEEKSLVVEQDGIGTDTFTGFVLIAPEKPSDDESMPYTYMVVESDDVLVFEYEDEVNSKARSETLTDDTEIVAMFGEQGVDGELDVQNVIQEGDEQVWVSVDDDDLKFPESEDLSEIEVEIENLRTQEVINITLTQKELDSSEYIGDFDTQVSTEPINEDGVLGVVQEDIIEAFYLDQRDSNGDAVLRTERREILGDGLEPQMTVEEPLWVGESVRIDVLDVATEEDVVFVDVINQETEQKVEVELIASDDGDGEFFGHLDTQFAEQAVEDESDMGVKSDDVVEFTYSSDSYDGDVSIERIAQGGHDGLLRVNPDSDMADRVYVREPIDIVVVDEDLNTNPQAIETVMVEVENEQTGQIINKELVQQHEESDLFFATLETQFSEQALESDNVLGTKDEDTLLFTYIDEFTSSGERNVEITENRKAIGGSDAQIDLSSDGNVGDTIFIEIVDEFESRDYSERNSINMEIVNERNESSKTLTLIETGPDSGVFVGEVETIESEEPVEGEERIGVINDDVVTGIYEDSFTEEGSQRTVTDSVLMSQGHDGSIEVSSPNEIGTVMDIKVEDIDLNVSENIDTATVTVENLNTNENATVAVEQTSEDSPVFTGVILGENQQVFSENEARGESVQSLAVSTGDYLEATYIDERDANGQQAIRTDKGIFIGEDALIVNKQTQQETVELGGFVPYSIEIENDTPNTLNDIEVVDDMPNGFRLASDEVYIEEQSHSYSVANGVITLTLDELEAGETIAITYVLQPSSGVVEGSYENTVVPYISNIQVGNEASATVRVEDSPLFADALVFGKVFHDRDGTGQQNKGDEGLAGVTLATVEGLNVVTDNHGRFHIKAVDVGRFERGQNFILKVMPETLPEGAVFTTENPRVRRITQGMPSRFNFGVQLPEKGDYEAYVEIKLGEIFFDWDDDTVKEQYKDNIKQIAQVLEQEGGGVLIIEGNTDSLGTDEYNIDLGLRRASSVYTQLKKHLSDEVYQKIDVKVEDIDDK